MPKISHSKLASARGFREAKGKRFALFLFSLAPNGVRDFRAENGVLSPEGVQRYSERGKTALENKNIIKNGGSLWLPTLISFHMHRENNKGTVKKPSLFVFDYA